MKLKGLKVEDFAHPDDVLAYKALEKSKINKLIEWLSSLNTRIILKTKLMGEYFMVSKESDPHLYRIINEVCETLDYDREPVVFTHRSPMFDYQIYLDESPVIILTDFVLNDYDDDMLRFHIGCAVTALKASTNQLKMAATFASPFVLLIPIFGPAILPVLADWCRKATYTENRGGLLACQNIEAALRTLIRTTGLPTDQIDTKVVPEIIQNYRKTKLDLVKVSQYFKTVYRIIPWKNDEIVEMMKWYSSGEYDDIMDEYQ